MPTNSPAATQFIKSKVHDVCTRHGIAHDSPLAAAREPDAFITEGGRDPSVRAACGSLDYSLEERLKHLMKDTKFRPSLPPEPPKVAKSDTEALRQNFDMIAAGKVRVTD